jgi:hypothetical protein
MTVMRMKEAVTQQWKIGLTLLNTTSLCYHTVKLVSQHKVSRTILCLVCLPLEFTCGKFCTSEVLFVHN